MLGFAQHEGIGTPKDPAAASGGVGSPEQLRREQEAVLLATVERGRG